MHVGDGRWVIVDSCLDSDGTPGALRHLENVGVDPARAVALIVATHWHDDHIRGISRLVDACPAAQFCCASALCRKEFLELVGALEGRHFSASGSGLRELHSTFSQLEEKKKVPIHAVANRVIFREGNCDIWSLSPSDKVFQHFLRSVGRLIPDQGENKTRIPSFSPNEVAVALWIDTGNFKLLLGADLERRGWVAILGSQARPAGQASVFKIPHHGSQNADEPAVWRTMLELNPAAILSPWHRGGRILPKQDDIERILATTPNAYASSAAPRSPRSGRNHANRMVAKTLAESDTRFRPLTSRASSIQLRRTLSSGTQWSVELFGDACHLTALTAA